MRTGNTQIEQSVESLKRDVEQLDLVDNFEAFEWEGELPNAVEVSIPNKIQAVPRRFIVVYTNDNHAISAGTVWTSRQLTLVNHAASTPTVRVIFQR